MKHDLARAVGLISEMRRVDRASVHVGIRF